MKTIFYTVFFIVSIISVYAQTDRYGILTQDAGSVFKMNQFGHPIELLHRFDTINGAEPQGSLVQRGNELYGRTKTGGLNGTGVIYYVNKDNHNFSTTQHLPADYNDGFLSPYTPGLNDDYYNMGCIANIRGRLYKTNFTLNTIQVAAEFAGYNTYYQPIMTLTDLFIPASLPGGSGASLIFRYDLSTQQLIDTLTLDPTFQGNGNFQLVQINDSIAYGINYNGGIYGEGVISKLNLNTFILDTLYSFNFQTTMYCPIVYSNSKLYLFNYNNSDSKFTCYSYENMQLDSLFSIVGNTQQYTRPGNIYVEGNYLVFSSDNVTYNYNHVSNTLTPISIIDPNQYGTTSYLNVPTIFYDPLSINDLPLEPITIFPNPTTSITHIQINNQEEKTVKIISSDGRLITYLISSNEDIQIDLNEYHNGLYLVEIEYAGTRNTLRLIKN